MQENVRHLMQYYQPRFKVRSSATKSAVV